MYNIALLQLARMMLFDEILLRPLNFLILSWTLDFKIAWLPTIPRWMENNIVGQHSKWVVIMIISCKTDGFVWKRSTGAARDFVCCLLYLRWYVQTKPRVGTSSQPSSFFVVSPPWQQVVGTRNQSTSDQWLRWVWVLRQKSVMDVCSNDQSGWLRKDAFGKHFITTFLLWYSAAELKKCLKTNIVEQQIIIINTLAKLFHSSYCCPQFVALTFFAKEIRSWPIFACCGLQILHFNKVVCYKWSCK